MNTIKQAIVDLWDSFAFRLLILGLAIGIAPIYILSLAAAHLGGN